MSGKSAGMDTVDIVVGVIVVIRVSVVDDDVIPVVAVSLAVAQNRFG